MMSGKMTKPRFGNQRGQIYHKVLNRIPKITIHLALITLGISMIFPFLWMLSTSFKESTEVMSYPPTFSSERLDFFFGYLLSEPWYLFVLILVMAAILLYYLVRPPNRLKWPKPVIDESRARIITGGFLFLMFIYFAFAVGIREWNDLFHNYVVSWTAQKFGRYFFNSCFIAMVTTTVQILSSALAAFAFAFLKFPGSNAIFLLFLGTMMIPHQALLVPDYLILANLGWINTYLSLIVPFIASVFGIFLLRQFFMTMPRDLYDASKIDGCSDLGFFFRILLPLSIAPMMTLGIFTFIGSWNSFLWALIVTHTDKLRTVQVGLAAFSDAEGTSYHLLMAASTFCILPLIIGFFLAQKQFIEGISRSGMKE